MLAWCSISVRSTASPARRLARPQDWATRLSDSVVFLVKTTSCAGSGAPTKRPDTRRARSYRAVASSAVA